MEDTENARKAYEAYRLDWMLSHGVTLTDLLDALKEQAALIAEEECSLEDPGTWIRGGEGAKALVDRAAGALAGSGIGGELFACYGEFLDCEYRDGAYMEGLLARTGPAWRARRGKAP